MSEIAKIAEAVKDHLNDGAYAFEFEAKRLAVWKTTVDDADGLLVSVFLGTRRAIALTRESYEHTYTVVVVIQKKLDASDRQSVEAIDALEGLSEDMEDSLEGVDMAGYSMNGFSEDEEHIPFDVSILKETGVFTSFFVLEYMG